MAIPHRLPRSIPGNWYPPRVPPNRPRNVYVHERPKGSGKWSVRYRDHDGTQREERGYKSKDAAATRAAEIRLDLNPRPRLLRPISELGDTWRTRHFPSIDEGTQRVYDQALRRIRSTPMWQQNAATLHTSGVIRWRDECLEQGWTPSQMRIALTVLSSVFQRSIEWGTPGIDNNPFRGVKRPREDTHLAYFPTRQDVARLAMTVPEPDAKWRSFLLIAAYCGLRPNEQLALEWASITHGELRVTRAVQSVGSGIKQPKTRRGVRIVPIPPFVQGVLEAWRVESGGRGLVLPTKNGTPYSRGNLSIKYWRPWRERAGLPDLQWRNLRHFYASTLAASGASILQCQRWMGHESFTTTEKHYAHLFDRDTDAVMQRLSESL